MVLQKSLPVKKCTKAEKGKESEGRKGEGKKRGRQKDRQTYNGSSPYNKEEFVLL